MCRHTHPCISRNSVRITNQQLLSATSAVMIGLRFWLGCSHKVGTASPGIGEAVGGAAPAVSRTPYDRSTSNSRHSGQRLSPNPTAASWQSA